MEIINNGFEPGKLYNLKCKELEGRDLYEELTKWDDWPIVYITEVNDCMYVRPEEISKWFWDPGQFSVAHDHFFRYLHKAHYFFPFRQYHRF